MKSKGTSYEAFIMFNVSFIGIYVKRDSTSKFTSRSVGRNRIFWTFYMKSIELVMWFGFSSQGSVWAWKRDKLYVGECIALTISLRGMFGLCIFDSPYSLDGRRFVGFNVDLVLLGMLLFSIRILVFCAIVLVESLSIFLYILSERRFFIFFL